MAFSVDGSSREAIQAIQFELWPDCKSGCSFCYLNGTKRQTSFQEKENNIKDAIRTLNNPEIMKDYNAVGLIGGEFFQGQLLKIYPSWDKLIECICNLLRTRKIKEVWIASSLIRAIEGDLIGTFHKLSELELDKDQRITLCTSYDTIGRFQYYFEFEEATEEDIHTVMEELHCETIEEVKRALLFNPTAAQAWLDNVHFIQHNFPKINIHVQIILTQDVINKLIDNPNYFDFLTDLNCIIDFRYPSITRADCPTATIIEDYRSILMEKYQNFPSGFFIESRAKFLKFLPIFANKYGLEKVRNLIHQPEMRSRRLKIYVEGAEIKDRWNDERDVYLDCGHLVDGLCYIDDSTHCIYCDIEKFLQTQEERAV